MKQLFGFVLLIFSALILLAVISGINGIFGSIASTWGTNETALVAGALSQIFFFGGIVFVAVLGFSMFNNTVKSSKGWSNGRAHEQEFQVLDNPQQRTQTLLANKETIDEWHDWNELERQLVE